jgi:hypothetical protein
MSGVGCADAFDKNAAGVRGGIPARDRGDCGAARICARAGRAGFALVGRDSSRAARVNVLQGLKPLVLGSSYVAPEGATYKDSETSAALAGLPPAS